MILAAETARLSESGPTENYFGEYLRQCGCPIITATSFKTACTPISGYSIRELPCRLDDRRPAIDLADQFCLQGFGRRFVQRHWLGVDVVESLHQIGIAQRFLQRLCEF